MWQACTFLALMIVIVVAGPAISEYIILPIVDPIVGVLANNWHHTTDAEPDGE